MEAKQNQKQKEEPELEFVGPRERLTPLKEVSADIEEPQLQPEPASRPEESFDEPDEPRQPGKVLRFRRWYFGHKKLTLPVTLLLILLVLAVVPFTRYAIAGNFLKQDAHIKVLDVKTGAPVSSATVKIGSATALTSGDGLATIPGIKVGKVSATISKKHYKDGTIVVTVPVLGTEKPFEARLTATGRQVNIVVRNFISGQAIAGVDILASDVRAKTDSEGNALIVLPAGPRDHPAELKYEGHNSSKVIITVKDTEIATNEFKLTPAGRIYYLSNASGNLDVMKSNLDGSDVKTVLAGTGSESIPSTILLTSPDNSHVALLARRDGSKAKVYMINTNDDKFSTVDEGSADFSLVGWSGSNLIYTASRTDLKPWQTGSTKLKSYSSTTGKLLTLDQTSGSGDAEFNTHEFYSFTYITGEQVVYAKGWTSQSPETADYSGKEDTLNVISANGQGKNKVAGYDAKIYATDFTAYKPGYVYILSSNREKDEDTYYEYEVGTSPKAISLTYEDFYKVYPLYYISSDGRYASWSEQRDGKTAVIVGKPDGSDGKQSASLEDSFTARGWHGSEYILLSKGSSEIHIMSASGGSPHKLADTSADNFWSLVP